MQLLAKYSHVIGISYDADCNMQGGSLDADAVAVWQIQCGAGGQDLEPSLNLLFCQATPRGRVVQSARGESPGVCAVIGK